MFCNSLNINKKNRVRISITVYLELVFRTTILFGISVIKLKLNVVKFFGTNIFVVFYLYDIL